MAHRIALVSGVTGLGGLNLAKRLVLGGPEGRWTVHGLSRHAKDYLPQEIKHTPCDLLDRPSVTEAVSKIKQLDTAFYCAYTLKEDEKENCLLNAKMLRNFLDALPSSTRHVCMLTGLKHYIGPFEAFGTFEMVTPFKESQPRMAYPNYYYDMEDVLFEMSASRGFTWSVARPSTIIGFAPGNIVNLGSTLAVYATICKHLNKPFLFPGCPDAYNGLFEITDAGLLAEHMVWEAMDPAAANQAFNVVNGDVFRWKYMWKTIADYFDLEVGEYKGQGFISWKGNQFGMKFSPNISWRKIPLIS